MLDITFCNTFQLPKISFKRNTKKTSLTLEVCEDLISLINDEYFDNVYLDSHILNKCIQITGSEYGFCGKIVGNEELHTKSITNIAWNESSFDFYKNNSNSPLIFKLNNTIFGCSVEEQKPSIINKYDYNRKVLPKGHPKIKRFCGVPLLIKGDVVYFIGLCNKLTNFEKSDVKAVEEILKVYSLVLSKE